MPEWLPAATSSSINPITAGNQAIVAKKKRAILYENGYSLPGKAAALLAAAAVSGIEHSQKLGRNLRTSKDGAACSEETRHLGLEAPREATLIET